MTKQRWIWAVLGVVAGHSWGATAVAAPVPDRQWGTYVNSYSPHIALDEAGNIYLAGRTKLGDNVATPGAHKEVAEGIEATLMKFDPAGNRIWGTFVGGEDQDGIWWLDVRGGAIAVCGATTSYTQIASPGTFTPIKTGLFAPFVATFTTDGAYAWGTYIDAGYSGSEPGDAYTCSVVLGPGGAVYVSGSLHEDGGLATPGAHKTIINDNANGDAFLLRLDAQGKLVWGTYYGGNGSDRSTQLVRDAAGALYLAGMTNSFDSIATVGAHQTVFGGGWDGFLARFSEGGGLDWGTYFGGISDDFGYSVAVHPGGGVVLVGQARSNGLATMNAYMTMRGGAEDAFVARFDAAGTRLWSTYFGGTGNDLGYAVAVDPLGGIYFGGTTWSKGLATPNAYQSEFVNSYAAMLGKFDGGGALQWATYYGDGLSSQFAPAERIDAIATWGSERVVVSGWTGTSTGLASPDAFLSVKPEGPNAGALASFSEAPAKACGVDLDCFSGHCVDGKCCDSACGGGVDDCQACSAAEGAAHDGHCGPSAPGEACSPAVGPCDVAELCTANSRECPADLSLPDDSPCNGGSCIDGQCVPEGAETTGEPGETTYSTDMSEGTDTSSSSDATTTTGAIDTTTEAADSSGASDTTGVADSTDPDSTAPDSTAPPTTGPTPTTSTSVPDSTDTSGGPPEGDEATDNGCSCSSRGPAPVLLLLAVVPLVRRRRDR